MAVVSPVSIHSKIQEQLNEINKENRNNDIDQIDVENQHDTARASIGVGRETTSELSYKKLVRNSVIGDECKYVGDMYAEKKHGKGVLSWSDGRTYTGAFYTDQRHGFGTFQTPNISEFKGLYCYDERFGPGVLIYKSSQSADVGFWHSEDLVRLLYPHPSINLDIEITDKKPTNDLSFVIPSWHSPQELLSNVIDLDFIMKKKPSSLFCKNVNDENSSLSRYLVEHSDRVQEAMHEKRAQVDAYLTSLTNENVLKEKILIERAADILPPNQTYEQQQLFYYTNKFLPLKQRGIFPLDEILSNTRSAFPNPGPLENAALNLFELTFNGQTNMVRDLLMHRQAYPDVCDSRGLTALHLATHNVHINVVNILLDFGANVNQLSDDSLTPLSIAFLLYYGNNPEQTINLALEHSDPIQLIPKTSPSVLETGRSNSKEQKIQQSRATTSSSRNLISRTSTIDENKIVLLDEPNKTNEIEKKNPYGYELTNTLHERIEDQFFRESVQTLIKLLLRRGADPSICDWPLPVLALAVRAGDKQMVELLLKKKAKVNCRLSPTRHANLTPLHIACGCLSPNAIDIVRLLLEHGAEVNAESLIGGKEYLSLADPTVVDLNKNEIEQHGRTPLHIACSRELTENTLSLVRLLLQYKANPNIVCNGQTPLSLAIAYGNESLVNLLLNHETTDPSTFLGLGNGNILCSILSTKSEAQWTYSKRLELIERIIAKNPKVLFPIRYGPKNTLGSSVDYAYYSYFADPRISQTPYHSLTPQERITFKERKELLSYIAKRFREEVTKYENFLRLSTPLLEETIQTPSEGLLTQRTISRARSFMSERTGDTILKTSNEFQYCANCGRSSGVRLTPCKRCRKVYFCSKPCKVAGWNAFHRSDCQTPILESPSERPITTTKTVSSKTKLPSVQSSSHQIEPSRLQSVGTSGTHYENLTALDGALFKGSILALKTPPKSAGNNRLPTLSVAKLLRQRRLKKMGKLGENFPPTLPACLQGVPLSWNAVYNAPENYSFN